MTVPWLLAVVVAAPASLGLVYGVAVKADEPSRRICSYLRSALFSS